MVESFLACSLWPPPARHYLSRRISKSSAGVITHYLYDGWNLIAEYTGTVLEKTYTWGMDLGGSMQGTGGVGGLLAVSEFTTQNSQVTIQNYYPTYDGNGNVSEYLDSTGATVAHYEYDAFGNTTVSTGTKKDDFAHRFSTKYQDDESGLYYYYYGYRYYDPVTGRWPSRDPVRERGGFNLYGMVENDAIEKIDYLGLYRTYKEALEAARDDIGEKTELSRLRGIQQLIEATRPPVDISKIINIQKDDLTVSRINNNEMSGVAGKEYGAKVYCDPSLPFWHPEKYDYVTKDGKMPSPKQMLTIGAGSVGIPRTPPGMRPLAFLHTHNVAQFLLGFNLVADLETMTNVPIAEAKFRPSNNGPSTYDEDLSDRLGGLLDLYIVHEHERMFYSEYSLVPF